jgi:hypothetical protein
MPQTVEIRNVPEELLRVLEACAVQEGKSLADFLLAKLHQIADVDFPDDRPTLAEWREHLHSRTQVDLGISTAEAIREIRGPLPPDDLPRR